MTSRLPPGLSPEDAAHLAGRAKNVIRQRMRQVRKATSQAILEQKSAHIVEHLLSLEVLQAARGLGLFWPIPGRGEVDLRALDARLRRLGKRLYYPFLRPKLTTRAPGVPQEPVATEVFETGFARLDDPAQLVQSGAFSQPPDQAPVAQRGELELIVAPALAASAELFRLGYGAGYYDNTLPDYCPPAQVIVVVFDFQIIAELPVEGHDFRCHAVLSEKRMLASDPPLIPASADP